MKKAVMRKNQSPFLSGTKVILRALELKDLEGPYIGWLNDEEVCQFNSHHVYPYAYEEARDFILSTRSNRSSLVLAMESAETGVHIGNIALQNIHPVNRGAEFSIMIGDKTIWGKGFAKEAGYLLCRHGFKELNLHRIYCGTEERNTGMQKLAAYLGMKEEGKSRKAIFKDGQYRDIIHYSILKEEF